MGLIGKGKFRSKIVFIIGMTLTAIAVVITLSLFSMKRELLDDRKVKTRHVVETAYGVLEHYDDLVKTGAMIRADAQAAAMKTVKGMRYEGKEYFWINDDVRPVPTMVMHPTVPSLDGRVLDDAKFNCATSIQEGMDGVVRKTDGRMNLFAAFVEVATAKGHGYVTYDWPKPLQGGGVTTERYPKMSYVKYFAPWGWVIGSGIYIDDIDAAFWKEGRRYMMLIAVIITIMVLTSLFIVRGVTRALGEAVRVSNSLAEGDLTVDIAVSSQDEMGQMLLAMKNMVGRLKGIASDVSSAANMVSEGSQRLSQGAEQVSQRTTEQAASAEEASSSVEEMHATIKQNADNALQTEKIALKSAADAQESAKAVTEAVVAMKNIAEKISIVEEIARQTNLLALNAAIEAARAGEHGRGFAVVAAEVRKLAERSHGAALEISELSRVSVDIAEQAGTMLARLAPDIQKTAELVQEISAASREQASGTDQINNSIQNLNHVVQQNAGAAEEISSTATELLNQADSLQNAVTFFKLNGNRNGRGAVHCNEHGSLPAADQRPRALALPRQSRQVRQPRAHAASHAGSGPRRSRGVHLDLGRPGGNSDSRDYEFEEY